MSASVSSGSTSSGRSSARRSCAGRRRASRRGRRAHACSDFHSALPLPDPGPASGSTSDSATTRRAGGAGDRGGVVGGVVVEHHDLVDEAPVRRHEVLAHLGHDARRRSRLRCAPGGTPRSSARASASPRRDRPDSRVSLRGTPGCSPASEPCYPDRANLTEIRAHQERLRDRPCDAAATSTEHRSRKEPVDSSEVPMPDR